MKYLYNILCQTLGKRVRRWGDNIKVDPEEITSEVV